jgi:hypothetical protein
MSDLNIVYNELKFWLPVIGAVGTVWKMRAAVTGWADKLFSNHLHHIEQATISTVEETKNTNKLLGESAQRDMVIASRVSDVSNTLALNHEKQLQVWQGVVNTLSVLEDRTSRRRSPVRTPARSPRKRA